MYRQIKNLERRLSWFNREAVTNDLFQEIIDKEGLDYYLYPFTDPIEGFYFKSKSGPAIGINDRLSYPDREIVSCRELGHHFLSHLNGFVLEAESPDLMPLFEYETKIFGALCLIPTPILEKEKDDALAEWPVEFRQFRWAVYQAYKGRICQKLCQK